MTKFEHRTQASAYRLMKATFVCSAVMFLSVVAAHGRTVELTLHPAKAPEPPQKYQLLPKAEELTDADAVPLYQQAIRSLPDEYSQKKFSEWRTMPLDELPAAQVKSELQKLKTTLQLIEQATKCKQCNWPAIEPGQVSNRLMDDLRKYRQVAFALDVQARLQMAEGQYEQAVGTARTSLGMARHLGEAPTLIQGMVGIAIAALSLNQMQELIQVQDGPNLYWALDDLPEPPVDISKAMELEMANLEKYNFLVRKRLQKQLKPAHDRVRMQMSSVGRKVAALQCVEALRLHAGSHEGKFPDKLSDITEVSVADDPAAGKPFSYSRTGSRAVLEAQGTEGSEGRDAIRYELNLTEK